MDVFRPNNPPAIQINESRCDSPGSQPYLRPPKTQSAALPALARPMTIPTRLDEPPPPPLPPPRYIEDLDHGFDPGWAWGNSPEGLAFGKTKLAPIRQGSSLQGGYLRGTPDSQEEGNTSDTEMEIDTSDRRGSSVSTLRSLPESERRQAAVTAAQIELQGERPLAQQTLEQSSKNYDRDLVNKFGKSPTASRLGLRGDSIPNIRSIPPTDVQPRSLSSIEIPSNISGNSPLRSAITSSALSSNVSPGWRDGAGFSGASSATTTASSIADLDLNSGRRRGGGLHSAGGSVSGLYDETNSISSRSNRGSYDQGLSGDVDMEHTDESRAFRQLHLDDRASIKSERRPSGQGQKRRRRSGSRDRLQDSAFPSHLNTTMVERFPSGFPRSPNSQNQPHHGSISSVSSAGLRNGSYASSAGFSVAATSMTSMSSIDKPSPGGMSPRSDVDTMHDSPYVTSTPLNQTASSLPTRPLKPATTSEHRASTSLPVKAVGQGSSRNKSSAKATGAFVCACCPKKPKRFATAEDLRVHTTEKQYECAYCGNRFKNKNEAERHQNSLHLRLHSWSCAAIAGPEAAFHLTNAGSGQGAGFAPTDSCGYCGEEFPNSPRQDWAARKEHLNVVHKFGECNKAKKFFRADHFRQHLKHSHAGTSGKWTNMLENACMKPEPPPDEATSPGEGDDAATNDDDTD